MVPKFCLFYYSVLIVMKFSAFFPHLGALNSSSNPVIYSTMKHIPVDVTDINK
jgi:hypothetical protein